METNEISEKAMGGTELMFHSIVDRLPEELLNEAQIIPSRVRDLKEDKIRILWQHDLPGDPESEHLKDRGWEKFHKIVFVSNWQMQKYLDRYDIPWEKCIVLQNAITPIPNHDKPDDGIIRLIYTPTPHRGLQILVPVFERLAEQYDNIELDVYSSFELYGWKERDQPYESLFELCRQHPKINYHGSVSNEEIRAALMRADIFAYPSIWPETSCLCLLEAMSAGLTCVHSNYGALSETASNWTIMYQFNETLDQHAGLFHVVLEDAIKNCKTDEMKKRNNLQKQYVDAFYNVQTRSLQWGGLINNLKNLPRGFPEQKFVYEVR